jgi:glycerol-3-phosphate dehydrogenase (NAD(P)+)
VRTILKELGQVAEGIRTAKAAHQLAQRLGVEAPIIQETYLAIYDRKPPQQAIRDLLARGPETER